jgi:methanogenic corrinoid protein MtbC1
MYMNFSKGVNKFNFHNDIAFNHYIDTVADMQSNFLSKSAVMRVAFLHQGQ